MPTHPKTTSSFAEKSDQYLREDCDGPPFAEHFAVKPLLTNVSGKSILCVGCGGGSECGALAGQGANVSAIDPSSALVKVARANNPGVDFKIGKAEQLTFSDNSFDIVYCAHVLHYLDDWALALSEIYRVLKPGGKLVVTIHHPIDYALDAQGSSRLLGYQENQELGDYLLRREVKATWYTDFDVVFYSRPISEMSNSFLLAHFTLESCVEAGGSPEARIPNFIAFALKKG